MPAHCATVLAVAAVVYDQDSHSEADLDFLYAVNAAGKEWIDTCNSEKLNWNGDVEAFEAVKRLATRQRDAAYAKALAELEAHDFEDELLQAAE
jgi:hypothetical protein